MTLSGYSIERRVPAQVETAAEYAFDDQVIGGGRGTDTYADVDFPYGRHVQIGHGEDHLLLIVSRVKVPERSVIGVVLDAAAHDAGKVVADLDTRCELHAFGGVRAVPGALERGVDGEIPAPDGLVD